MKQKAKSWVGGESVKKGKVTNVWKWKETMVTGVVFLESFFVVSVLWLKCIFMNTSVRYASYNLALHSWLGHKSSPTLIRGERHAVWTFEGTWDKDIFRQIAFGFLDLDSSDASKTLSDQGQVMTAAGDCSSAREVSWRSHLITEVYPGSGHQTKLAEYPILTLVFETISAEDFFSVIRSLKTIFNTDFNVRRLEGGQNGEGMSSCSVFAMSSWFVFLTCWRYLKLRPFLLVFGPLSSSTAKKNNWTKRRQISVNYSSGIHFSSAAKLYTCCILLLRWNERTAVFLNTR